MSRRIDPATLPVRVGSAYPAPFDEPCKGRRKQVFTGTAGLTQFGVNLTRLPPGGWSAQRHWHATEDEFVYILEGEAWLVTDAGEELLRAGDAAGFPAGVQDGHHLQNRGSVEVVFLEVGSRRSDDHGEYPEIDLAFGGDRYAGKGGYFHKDGRPY